MKVNYVRKLETMKKELQGALMNTRAPELIWITYIEYREIFEIKKQYRGAPETAEQHKEIKDCIIPAWYTGTVLVDLMSCPDVEGFTVANIREIREECGIPLDAALYFDNPKDKEGSRPPELEIEIHALVD